MDTNVDVSVLLTVKVAGIGHDNPEQIAREMITSILAPYVRPDHNWDGRFAIITDDRMVVSATVGSGD